MKASTLCVPALPTASPKARPFQFHIVLRTRQPGRIVLLHPIYAVEVALVVATGRCFDCDIEGVYD